MKKKTNLKMCRCGNVQTKKEKNQFENVQIWECANEEKKTNVQMCRCGNVQMNKKTNVQMCKFKNVQMKKRKPI